MEARAPQRDVEVVRDGSEVAVDRGFRRGADAAFQLAHAVRAHAEGDVILPYVLGAQAALAQARQQAFGRGGQHSGPEGGEEVNRGPRHHRHLGENLAHGLLDGAQEGRQIVPDVVLRSRQVEGKHAAGR